MKVADISGIAKGMSVAVGPSASAETSIQKAEPDLAPATSGTLTFTPAFANATHVAGSTVSHTDGSC